MPGQKVPNGARVVRREQSGPFNHHNPGRRTRGDPAPEPVPLCNVQDSSNWAHSTVNRRRQIARGKFWIGLSVNLAKQLGDPATWDLRCSSHRRHNALDRLAHVTRHACGQPDVVEDHAYNAIGALSVNAGVAFDMQRPRLDNPAVRADGAMPRTEDVRWAARRARWRGANHGPSWMHQISAHSDTRAPVLRTARSSLGRRNDAPLVSKEPPGNVELSARRSSRLATKARSGALQAVPAATS